MLLWIYKIGTTLLVALSYPVFWWKARSDRKWRERLGRLELKPADVWIHASSMGEVKVIAHLVHFLQEKRPQLRLHVTTMTSAGQRAVDSDLGDQVSKSYSPLDAPAVVRRAFDAIQPKILVIAETEIWPNLVCEANRRGVPIVLVNGRMTQKAFSGYWKASYLIDAILSKYDRFFFKAEEDAVRYQHFAIEAEHCIVSGDMKFDAPLPDRSEERISEARKALGVPDGSFLMVAGSTRKGEEAMLVDLFRSARAQNPDFRLAVAPRHVERAEEIGAMWRERGLTHSLYGQPAVDGPILIDRLGLLNDIYVASDFAFVGGTLVDIGGHNLLEPVWAGTPTLFGPSLYNVAEAADYILENNYGARIETADELTATTLQTMSGEASFGRKTEDDLTQSATAQAGEYILGRLDHA